MEGREGKETIMASNTSVTLIGRVGSKPSRYGNSQQGICTFRLASSRGYYDRATGKWKEQSTTWVTVKTYRTLADNVLRSVRKGEPVIVSGSLITESWTDRATGELRAMNVIEANAVGHDLSRGTADFNRPERKETAPPQDAQDATEGSGAAEAADASAGTGGAQPQTGTAPPQEPWGPQGADGGAGVAAAPTDAMTRTGAAPSDTTPSGVSASEATARPTASAMASEFDAGQDM